MISSGIRKMQAFVAMRKTLGNLHGVIQRLEGVEMKQLQTDGKLEQIFQALEKGTKPTQGIFFEGKLFGNRTIFYTFALTVHTTLPVEQRPRVFLLLL